MADISTPERTSPVVEVEFSLSDSRFPFIYLSAETACRFELVEMISRSDGRYAEFYNVTGAGSDRITAAIGESEYIDVTVLTEYENGGLFEFLVAGDCPAHRLAELGALPRQVEGVDGEGCIVVEIPLRSDPAAIVGTFLDDYPTVELVTKRKKDSATPRFSDNGFQQALISHLTDRQREVLEAAFEAGYYDWPRRCTGTDVAEMLGISSPTFSEHIHAAERNLLTAIFDGSSQEWNGRSPLSDR